MDMDGDRTSREYWDQRAIEPTISDRQRIWYGSQFEAQENWVRDILKPWKDGTVLDLGCGDGRYAKDFRPENYLGVDFSENMIARARAKNPRHHFEVGDADEYVPRQKYDVIFANMLTNKQDLEVWIERLRPFCNKVIIRGFAERVLIVSAEKYE